MSEGAAQTGGVMQRRSPTERLSLMVRGVLKGMAIAANLCLVAMLVITFLNVVLRYVAKRPLYWGDEVIINLMIVMVYAGFGFVLIEGGHIRMTAVFSKLPGKVQNALWIIASFIGLGYASLILYAVVMLVLASLEMGSFSPTTRWPIAPWQVAVAFGLFCLVMAFVMLIVTRIGIALGIHEEKVSKEKLPDY